jgi:hypothetical protein
VGVGVVLMQDHHPLAFVSKSLEPKLRGLSAYEKRVFGCIACYRTVEAIPAVVEVCDCNRS